jgi:hypothetical protein
LSKNEILRADTSHDLNLIHIKPYDQIHALNRSKICLGSLIVHFT